MARQYTRLARECRDPGERPRKCASVGERKVGPPDGTREETVPHQGDPVPVDHDVPRRVPRRVEHGEAKPAQRKRHVRFELGVWIGRLFDLQPKGRCLVRDVSVQPKIGWMQENGDIPDSLHRGDGTDMIDVGVGEPDCAERDTRPPNSID
jgi:hypothetical protein